MGQQPNLDTTAVRPRPEPEPAPARRWRPQRPGVITSPAEVPVGGPFGTPGPDPGWALRILRAAELPDDDPDLRHVLGALMNARAAALGRAPVREDLDAALVLCGYNDDAPDYIVERRQRWLAAVPHEPAKGQTAVAEVEPHLLVAKPDQIRWAQKPLRRM